MTDLLQQAFSEIRKLPPSKQDAIATRILADLKGEHAWTSRFEATTDEQWDRLAEAARKEIAASETIAFEDVFPTAQTSPPAPSPEGKGEQRPENGLSGEGSVNEPGVKW